METREGSDMLLLKERDHEPQNIGYRIHRLPLEAENDSWLMTVKEMGPESYSHMGSNSADNLNELGKRFISQSLW